MASSSSSPSTVLGSSSKLSFAVWIRFALVVVGAVVVSLVLSLVWCEAGGEDWDLDVIRVAEGQCRVRGEAVDGRKKIVGLVEVRNVAEVVGFFLAALSEVVDSVVVLDDHSSDATVAIAKVLGESGGARVEVIVRKRGKWTRREEMRDRNILLRHGREIGGTHFVLLDYDEFFAASCARDGNLRRAILELEPGQGLNLRWYEAWKSPHWHRVLPDDKEMNFLKRRQTVVFADDGKVEYEIASTLSRQLEDPQATIHTLRCPRNLCGRTSDRPFGATDCGIVEMRFVNMDNVVLKSAWYEALGRRAGVDDSVVRGKMMDILFGRPINRDATHTPPPAKAAKKDHRGARDSTKLEEVVEEEEEEVVRPLPAAFLDYPLWDDHLYDHIEVWRAEEILQWDDQHTAAHANPPFLHHLPVASTIRWDLLRDCLRRQQRRPRPSATSRFSSSLGALPRYTTGRLSFVLHASTLSKAVVDYMSLLVLPTGAASAAAAAAVRGCGADALSSVQDRLRAEQELRRQRFIPSCVCILRDPATRLAWLELAASALSDVQVDVFAFVSRGDEPTLSRSCRVDGAAAAAVDASFDGALQFILRQARERFHVRVHEVDIDQSLRLANARRLVGVVYRADPRRTTGAASAGVDWLAIVQAARTARRAREDSKSSDESGVRPSPKLGRLILSWNPGRSGSRYLADLLQTVRNPVVSLHEPPCPDRQCSGGGALRMQDVLLASSYERRRRIKLPMILAEVAALLARLQSADRDGEEEDEDDEEAVRTGGGDPVPPLLVVTDHRGEFRTRGASAAADVTYIETNPNFKSWFYDVVLEELGADFDVAVVVLHKWLPALLRSLYETGFFSTRDGYQWMETANSVNSRISALGPDAEQSALELLISYILNAEATARYVASLEVARHVQFVHARSEEIFRRPGALRLLEELGLLPSEATLRQIGRVNDKYRDRQHRLRSRHTDDKDSKDGKLRVLEISLRECELAWTEYRRKAQEAKIEIVDTVARLDEFDYK